MEQNTVTVKAQYKDDLRRISIPKTISFSEFSGKLKALFHLSSGIVLKYTDEDGDQITLTTDIELVEAIRLATYATQILRVTITDKPVELIQKEVQKQEEPKKEEPKVEPKKEEPKEEPKIVENQMERAPEPYDVALTDMSELTDASKLPPKTLFTKVWLLENVGTKIWPTDTVIRHISGENMFAEVDEVAVGEVEPTKTAKVTLELITPTRLDRNVGYYRLFSPSLDKGFGQVLSVDIIVDPSAPSPKKEKPMEEPKKEEPVQETPKKEEPKEKELYGDQLDQLEQMGFTNRAKNRQLLQKHKGDLPSVVNALLM